MSPPGTVHLSQLGCQHGRGMKRLLEALGGAPGTSFGVWPKRLDHPLPLGRDCTARESRREGREPGEPPDLQITPRDGELGEETEAALRTLSFIQHLVLPDRHRRRKKSLKRDCKDTKKMTQESHQMGLDTRENAAPVTRHW